MATGLAPCRSTLGAFVRTSLGRRGCGASSPDCCPSVDGDTARTCGVLGFCCSTYNLHFLVTSESTVGAHRKERNETTVTLLRPLDYSTPCDPLGFNENCGIGGSWLVQYTFSTTVTADDQPDFSYSFTEPRVMYLESYHFCIGLTSGSKTTPIPDNFPSLEGAVVGVSYFTGFSAHVGYARFFPSGTIAYGDDQSYSWSVTPSQYRFSGVVTHDKTESGVHQTVDYSLEVVLNTVATTGSCTCHGPDERRTPCDGSANVILGVGCASYSSPAPYWYADVLDTCRVGKDNDGQCWKFVPGPGVPIGSISSAHQPFSGQFYNDCCACIGDCGTNVVRRTGCFYDVEQINGIDPVHIDPNLRCCCNSNDTFYVVDATARVTQYESDGVTRVTDYQAHLSSGSVAIKSSGTPNNANVDWTFYDAGGGSDFGTDTVPLPNIAANDLCGFDASVMVSIIETLFSGGGIEVQCPCQENCSDDGLEWTTSYALIADCDKFVFSIVNVTTYDGTATGLPFYRRQFSLKLARGAGESKPGCDQTCDGAAPSASTSPPRFDIPTTRRCGGCTGPDEDDLDEGF